VKIANVELINSPSPITLPTLMKKEVLVEYPSYYANNSIDLIKITFKNDIPIEIPADIK
jgi:hypothetical protein